MWYGYVVSATLKGVTKNYQLIKNFQTLYPYMKYRKFREEEGALYFIERHGKKDISLAVVRYGNVFRSHHVRVEYFIDEGTVYYNVDTSKFGYVKLHTNDDNIIIENRTSMILVTITNIQLNNNLISSHLAAIYQILDLLGSYLDVDIKLPDESVFYTLTRYKGTKSNILRVLRYIKDRDGEVSYTTRRY